MPKKKKKAAKAVKPRKAKVAKSKGKKAAKPKVKKAIKQVKKALMKPKAKKALKKAKALKKPRAKKALKALLPAIEEKAELLSSEAVFEGPLFRVLRDLKIFFAAEPVLRRLRESLPLTASPAKYEQRLVTMELGLELASFSLGDNPTPASLAALTRKIKEHYLALRGTNEDISPALSLLVHCEYLTKLYGFPADKEIKEIIHSGLPEVPAELAQILDAVSSPTPDGRGLISLVKSLEEARYYQDIAFDLTHIATAARRFLDADLSQENVQTVILAIEMLSDLAIRRTSIVGPNSTFSSPETTFERAVAISRNGYQVVFLGLSQAGRLIRVNVVDGAVTEVLAEQVSVFSRDRFRGWSEDFPYK